MIISEAELKVKYIKPSKSKGYLRVGVDSGETTYDFNVKSGDYRLAGSPLVGDEADGEMFRILQDSDSRYRALKVALGILSYSDNSVRMLKFKLKRHGFDTDTAEFAVSEVLRLGYIDERRQVGRLVSDLVNRSNLGRRKITEKIVAKGYSASLVSSVTDELSGSGEIDFQRAMDELVAKHSPFESDEEKYKLLFKYGFDTDM